MNPYDHARSSARRFGGRSEDYQPIHDWFDSSKTTLCHFLHRALHHHREGVAEAIERFGPTIVLADGAAVPTEDVAVQHVEEDCRRVPAAADWVRGFAAPEWWPAIAPEAEALADSSARRFGGTADTYLPLHRWLLATADWNAGPAHFLFRHHAFGLFEAERRFGPALAGHDAAVPTRVIGERHIRTVLGRIPAASDLLRRLRGEHWMARATPASEAGLS